MQEKVALIVPTKVTTAGSRKVLDKLKRAKVKVLGKGKNLIVVPLTRSVKSKLLKISEISEYHCGEVPKSAIKRLPPESQRLVELWNWSIISKRKKVISLKPIMRKLKLEIDNQGNVIDKTTGKSLGKIKHEEKLEKQGNWSLWYWRSWAWAPGPPFVPGYFRKYGTTARTYATSTPTTAMFAVDQIVAEVDGPHHYSFIRYYNRWYAHAEHWNWVWMWESDWCEHRAWAKEGNTIRQGGSRTTFRS